MLKNKGLRGLFRDGFWKCTGSMPVVLPCLQELLLPSYECIARVQQNANANAPQDCYIRSGVTPSSLKLGDCVAAGICNPDVGPIKGYA
jgi:hypothetical protein